MKSTSVLIISLGALMFLGAGCNNQPTPIKVQETAEVSAPQIDNVPDTKVEEIVEEKKPEQKSYTTYSGAYFDIEYPSDYRIDERVLDESMKDKYAEVAFISPNENVEFYVFSPLWGGVADYETVLDSEEVVAEQENSTGDEFSKTTTKWITIEAKDKSYARSMRIITTNDETVRYLFGIKYTSKEALDEAREEYNHFTNSLVQYADA